MYRRDGIHLLKWVRINPNRNHPQREDMKSSKLNFLVGSGLKCHQCNSYDNYHCGDPFYYPDSPEKPKTEKFLKECPDDQEYTFCRKIYQKGKL